MGGKKREGENNRGKDAVEERLGKEKREGEKGYGKNRKGIGKVGMKEKGRGRNEKDMGGGKKSTVKKLGTRKGKMDRRRGNDDRGRERWKRKRGNDGRGRERWMGKEGMMAGEGKGGWGKRE
jgi:hypothetical protein